MPTLARLSVLALAVAPAIALAQPQGASGQPADPEDIVVTGEALDEQVQNFVQALTPAPVRGQIGRFERAVCPAAVGVPPAQRLAIAARMRQVAQGGGLAVARDGCRPNVVVVVTEDKTAFLQALRRRQPGYFGGLDRSQIERLLATPGPAAAWQTPGPAMNADGVEVADNIQAGDPTNRTTRVGSRITAPSRVQFGNAVVVVERRALQGLTTTQLADYAAMRAFAKADPARLREPMPSTILTVLDAPMGGAVPVTLTAWDLNFLRGLYSSRGDLYAPAQRGEIGDRMRQALERPGGS